jgi:hypothetical protein
LNLTHSLYEKNDIELSAAFSIYPRSDVKVTGKNLYDFSDINRVIIGFCMRTELHRYTEWIHVESGKTVDKELYDHRNDDLEAHNVAGDRANEELIGLLSTKLHSHYDEAIPGI